MNESFFSKSEKENLYPIKLNKKAAFSFDFNNITDLKNNKNNIDFHNDVLSRINTRVKVDHSYKKFNVKIYDNSKYLNSFSDLVRHKMNKEKLHEIDSKPKNNNITISSSQFGVESKHINLHDYFNKELNLDKENSSKNPFFPNFKHKKNRLREDISKLKDIYKNEKEKLNEIYYEINKNVINKNQLHQISNDNINSMENISDQDFYLKLVDDLSNLKEDVSSFINDLLKDYFPKISNLTGTLEYVNKVEKKVYFGNSNSFNEIKNKKSALFITNKHLLINKLFYNFIEKVKSEKLNTHDKITKFINSKFKNQNKYYQKNSSVLSNVYKIMNTISMKNALFLYFKNELDQELKVIRDSDNGLTVKYKSNNEKTMSEVQNLIEIIKIIMSSDEDIDDLEYQIHNDKLKKLSQYIKKQTNPNNINNTNVSSNKNNNILKSNDLMKVVDKELLSNYLYVKKLDNWEEKNLVIPQVINDLNKLKNGLQTINSDPKESLSSLEADKEKNQLSVLTEMNNRSKSIDNNKKHKDISYLFKHSNKNVNSFNSDKSVKKDLVRDLENLNWSNTLKKTVNQIKSNYNGKFFKDFLEADKEEGVMFYQILGISRKNYNLIISKELEEKFMNKNVFATFGIKLGNTSFDEIRVLGLYGSLVVTKKRLENSYKEE